MKTIILLLTILLTILLCGTIYAADMSIWTYRWYEYNVKAYHNNDNGINSLNIHFGTNTNVDSKVTRTLNNPITLNNSKNIKFNVKSQLTGQKFKVRFINDYNNTITNIDITPNIITTDTWQELIFNIEDIVPIDKCNIIKYEITPIDTSLFNSIL